MPSKLSLLLFLLAVGAWPFPTVAQSLADGVPVFKSGGWTVLRTTNAMTDKTSCTGVLDGNYGIQLAEDSLYIRVRGGIRSITLRFDEDAPERMRLPTDFERKGTIVITGNDFRKALGSIRLRTQVMTILDRVDQQDLNLSGIIEAHKNIRDGCPGPAIEGGGKTVEFPLCSKLVLDRMRNLGISPENIKAICSN